MKKLIFLILFPFCLTAQETPNSILFWDSLQSHCGKAYEGEIIAGGKAGDGFVGEKLVMHFRSCEKNTIRIPFFVGKDKSRTWVLTKNEKNLITNFSPTKPSPAFPPAIISPSYAFPQ